MFKGLGAGLVGVGEEGRLKQCREEAGCADTDILVSASERR